MHVKDCNKGDKVEVEIMGIGSSEEQSELGVLLNAEHSITLIAEVLEVTDNHSLIGLENISIDSFDKAQVEFEEIDGVDIEGQETVWIGQLDKNKDIIKEEVVGHIKEVRVLN